MDFRGQRHAEIVGMGLMVLSAIVGWIVGYINSDLKITLKIFGVGFVAAFAVSSFPLLCPAMCRFSLNIFYHP